MNLSAEQLVALTGKSKPSAQARDYTLEDAQRFRRALKRFKILPLDQLRGLPDASKEDCQPGVYFLWWGPALMYIGQSQNVSFRIGQHRYFRKQFTHATYEKINEHWTRHRERDYVLRYSPPLNMTRLG